MTAEGASVEGDAVVVGGGVIGLACALFLRRQGARVRLLERRQLGSGASWGNCGLITPSHADPLTQPASLGIAARSVLNPAAPLRIVPTLDLQRLAWLARFALHCREGHRHHARSARAALLQSTRTLVDTLFEGLGQDDAEAAWSPSGLTTVFQDPRNFADIIETHEQERDLGIPFDIWAPDVLREREPLVNDRAVGAIHAPLDGHVDPREFCDRLAARARAEGVVIEQDSGVEQLLLDSGRVVGVQTATGPIRARHTVVAAGAWSTRLARRVGIRLPVEPAKGYSITWDAAVPGVHTPLYFYEPKVVATPWPHGFRLGSTMEFVGYDEALDPRRLGLLTRGARQFLDHPLEMGEGQPWCGWRPMSVDEIPIIGPSGRLPGLVWACGHGVLGMSQSLATGRLVAEQLASRDPHIDPAPYCPERFGA